VIDGKSGLPGRRLGGAGGFCAGAGLVRVGVHRRTGRFRVDRGRANREWLTAPMPEDGRRPFRPGGSSERIGDNLRTASDLSSLSGRELAQPGSLDVWSGICSHRRNGRSLSTPMG